MPQCDDYSDGAGYVEDPVAVAQLLQQRDNVRGAAG